MNQEQQVETAARAIRDAVRINIRPGGETVQLLDKGHTFHLNPDEANTAARAVLAAIHPTVSVWEDTDDGWFYEGSKDDEFPMSRPICRRPVVDPEYLRKQAAQFLAVADAIEGGAV